MTWVAVIQGNKRNFIRNWFIYSIGTSQRATKISSTASHFSPLEIAPSPPHPHDHLGWHSMARSSFFFPPSLYGQTYIIRFTQKERSNKNKRPSPSLKALPRLSHDPRRPRHIPLGKWPLGFFNWYFWFRPLRQKRNSLQKDDFRSSSCLTPSPLLEKKISITLRHKERGKKRWFQMRSSQAIV